MRVMITGATGFVGYHTAQALLDAGHEVSLLVRSVDKMLALFGQDRVQQVTRGDITDADQVARALQGCDAVVHSAAMVSTSAADAKRVYQTNVEGTRLVLAGAIERGIGRIIHVSSVTALYDPAASRLDENSPPGHASNAYGRSKVACERHVRDLQDRGAPVFITYPAQVIGPDDPGLTEPHRGLQLLLQGIVPCTSSGTQYVDVRDIALVHRQLLEQDVPGNRYAQGAAAGHRGAHQRPALRQVWQLAVAGPAVRVRGHGIRHPLGATGQQPGANRARFQLPPARGQPAGYHCLAPAARVDQPSAGGPGSTGMIQGPVSAYTGHICSGAAPCQQQPHSFHPARP